VILGRLTGIPSAVSLRGNDVDRSLFHGARLPLLSSALRLADAVLGVSSEILESAALVAQRKDGFHLVPNSVDSGVFRPGLPLPEDALSLLADAPRPWLAFTGELRLKKGLPLLLELAETMAAMSLGTLVLVGGVRGGTGESTKGMGTLSARGRARIREVPWSDDTRRLAALYGAMDLFVFPSLWEGMPNALLESMACARPSLATAVGGVAEVVENDISGFLLQRGELGRFVGEAIRLAQESATLERVGRAARLRVVTSFTPDREREGILEVYRKLAR
jgi:glycosyltransferase involved in cell wall biosynthesis